MSKVRFGGMETDPGHADRPAHGIGIVGLMHMPEKTDPGGFHRQCV